MTVETVHPRSSILTRTSALLVGTAAAVTLVACSSGTPDTTAAAPSSGASGAPFNPSDLPASVAGRTSMQAVEFKNGDITMAGNVFVPADFDANRTYPTIVVVHPGGGVKEQTAGVYAQRLADQGFVTLAFDASYQGASGGMPRFLDNPMNRVGDIYSAVDYLTTLPYVDDANIGILGICAGGGVTIKASTTDPRIKSVATVCGVDTGAVASRGWDGDGKFGSRSAGQPRSRCRAAHRRSRWCRTRLRALRPSSRRHHRTPGSARGGRLLPHPSRPVPHAPNKMLMSGQIYTAGFNGFDRIDTLLTQPLLVVAGSDAGSLWHSEELYNRAASTQKELAIIPGATHMDLYDGPGVDQSMQHLTPFFTNTL